VVKVYTARMGIRDPDYLDVTRTGNERRKDGEHRGIGLAFAPSGAILWPAKRGELGFEEYQRLYTAEMRQSYRTRRQAWDELLSWERVVLLCFCTEPLRCHRTVLAGILVKLGAEDCGELLSTGPAPAR